MPAKGKKIEAKSKQLIQGVQVKQLKWISGERGKLMEMLRCDETMFEKFGQVYITTGYPGAVKAWHYHQNQSDNMVVIKGMAKVALYDSREASPPKGMVNEFFIGEDNPMLIHIPNKGTCSWYDFTREILKQAGLKTPVIPITSSEYPQKAKRPGFSVLDNYHLRLLGMDDMRPWQEALKDYMRNKRI